MLFIKIWLTKAIATYLVWRILGPKRRRSVKDFAWRLFGFHDSYGLKYSWKHLEKMRTKIIHLPVTKMARYADKQVKDMIRDRIETRTMLQAMYYKHFPTFNATSIGNLAYISLHSYDKRVRKQADDIIQDYIQWIAR